MLSGAAGYGYGAYGVWNFYSPDNPNGETGKLTVETIPWQQALNMEGSGQLKPVQELFSGLPWWRLTPACCTVNASEVSPARARVIMIAATATANDSMVSDTTTPVGALTPNGDLIVYFPRDERKRELHLPDLDGVSLTGPVEVYWYDPRSAERTSVDPSQFDKRSGVILATPTNDDWVFVLDRGFSPCDTRQKSRHK
ncbi:MAG: DUF4038 domain-containing protein [Pirellulaceae bacterium]|nr:DUF4038 domain-containing protein [Pirellulaceae bacterium]